MTAHAQTARLTLTPEDNNRLLNLCGPFERHIQMIQQHFNVTIHHRGHFFTVKGEPNAVQHAKQALKLIYQETRHQQLIEPKTIHMLLQQSSADIPPETPSHTSDPAVIHMPRLTLKARTERQKLFIDNIRAHDINFAIGPAGTGKTYISVATAIEALEQQKVQRLLFVRPAVEAGEKLGFLPGDIAEKVLPYLRPLYDALYEMLGCARVAKLIEQNVIEIAPLAFMRGRTLNESFIILDEAQNTTRDQMKMFLTRIGFSSTAVITGDVTQVDLAKGTPSGLDHAMQLLSHIDQISFTQFQAEDTVRHPLVQSIIKAYESDDGT